MIITISEIYSKPFNCPINQCHYVGMVDELYNKDYVIGSKYYYMLLDMLRTHKEVWGYIKNENDVIERVRTFKSLVRNIVDSGFKKEQNEISYLNGLPYGKITYITENGKLQVVDGHHRISILIYMGYTEFKVKENYLVPIR